MLSLLDRNSVKERPGFKGLPDWYKEVFDRLTLIFPYRINSYIESLIPWESPAVLDDPLFRLYHPMPEMLSETELEHLRHGVDTASDASALAKLSVDMRMQFNPQPAGQLTHNVPIHHGQPVAGVQHKYQETILLFPSQGQQCYTFCTYCFRAPQFSIPIAAGKQIGLDDELRFSTAVEGNWFDYLQSHSEITDVLLTGGEVLFARASVLEPYIDRILQIDHVETIRFGAKVLSHWPKTLSEGHEAEAKLKLFAKIKKAGKHVAFMAHFSHPRELEHTDVLKAIERIQATGAIIRSQAPIMRYVNDHAHLWAELWRKQVLLGLVPYYMFQSRDTGADEYWSLPLVESLDIFRRAQMQVSGLARTARLSMSTLAGKVGIEGITNIGGQKVICLSMVQARDPNLVATPFFARWDPNAIWLDGQNGLTPAFADSWPWEQLSDQTDQASLLLLHPQVPNLAYNFMPNTVP